MSMGKLNGFSDWLLRAWTVQAMRECGWTYAEIGRALSISGACACEDMGRLTGRRQLPYLNVIVGPVPRHCECGGHMRVIDVRDAGDWVRRRRECEECGERITTRETIV
jgi:hypothetical protein